MVRTPMMMPRSVKKVLSLLARREIMAIEKDSLICSLAIVFSVLFYTRSYGEAKKRFSASPWISPDYGERLDFARASRHNG
jgi:hypothetical protein